MKETVVLGRVLGAEMETAHVEIEQRCFLDRPTLVDLTAVGAAAGSGGWR
jgi:hypothetical protein